MLEEPFEVDPLVEDDGSRGEMITPDDPHDELAPEVVRVWFCYA